MRGPMAAGELEPLKASGGGPLLARQGEHAATGGQTTAAAATPEAVGTEEEAAALTSAAKVVKRGRGGRRAGAGRKRKSEAAKAEAAALATAGSSEHEVLAAPTSAKGMASYSSRSVGSGPAGSASNGPAQKKKKLSSPIDEVESMKKAPRQLKFGYTILYVKEVEATVEFYERAFGLRRRFVHETKQYAELETGATALSFASNELARNNLAPVEFLPNDPNGHPPGMEIAFSSSDVHRDYRRALEAGAKSVSVPKTLPWGQVVAYVRDLNGVLVEIASELKTPLRK